ncbi:DNA fragmentation factor-related protein 4 isoform X2 [Rhipicephalus microplus]|uniref:DNA fragmentation factor-related protein 4 isoform X2 n=1 Tax=Rhipicephalus microplus TaxID=6941 RepID=UPI003F6C68DA
MTGGVVRQARKVNGAQHVECKQGRVKSDPRPYIVSNFVGQRKLVTGSTCEDLLASGCKLFEVPKTDCRLVLEDGTEIDDEYLATCGDYTVLVILKASEQIKWEKRAVSKRSVLRERAKTRIKGYYYKSKDEMQKRLGESKRGCVRHLFEEFLQLLKQNDHNGHYFVRGEAGALCLSDGQFNCQGTFSKDLCSGRLHAINPYASREQLVIFSTWNLDHRIERSRSILPTMSKAIQLADGRAVNAEYFYRLLFTTENLKLVHPVCHIKSEHDGYCCDPGSWYSDNTMPNDGRGDESVKSRQSTE